MSSILRQNRYPTRNSCADTKPNVPWLELGFRQKSVNLVTTEPSLRLTATFFMSETSQSKGLETGCPNVLAIDATIEDLARYSMPEMSRRPSPSFLLQFLPAVPGFVG